MSIISRRTFLERSFAIGAFACPNIGLKEVSASKPSPFDELIEYDTLDLARLIKSKELSQAELVEIIIRRIEAVNPEINFLTTPFYERAEKRAGSISIETPFAGVPLLLKDMTDLGGMLRTDGSNFPPNNIPQNSARYVTGLETAGFNFLGMTNVSEHAGVGGTDNIRFGATRNPWNLDFYPFMSSGGTAACVASGVMTMAHGTDGAGSNRLPASVTGLLGVKPTRYRMLADSHDGTHDIAKTNQMISRTVRENALAFHLTQDPNNGLYPFEDIIQPRSMRSLKVGVAFDNPGLIAVTKDIRETTENSANMLEMLGHTVTEVSYPVSAEDIYVNYTNFFAGKTAALKNAIESVTGKSVMEADVLSPFIAGTLEANSRIPQEKISSALEFLNSVEPTFDNAFKSYDILLTPVSPMAGLRINEIGARTAYSEEALRLIIGTLKFTAAINFSGCPAMSVPLNWDGQDGLPIGTQCIAARGNDRLLYELAYQLEEAYPWRDRWAPHSLLFSG